MDQVMYQKLMLAHQEYLINSIGEWEKEREKLKALDFKKSIECRRKKQKALFEMDWYIASLVTELHRHREETKKDFGRVYENSLHSEKSTQ